MKKKTIIFDFDGTIANTFNTIITLYNKIAPKYNCMLVPHEHRTYLQGQRPQDVFGDYGITKMKIPFIIYEIRKALHREIKNIEPIEGIIEALKEIKDSGFTLGIMTSNSKKNVGVFLKQHNIESLFNFIYSGRNIFNKASVLRKLLKKEQLEKDNVFYIGDETRDIEATKKAEIPMIAVTWGFNDLKSLQGLSPFATVETPKALVEKLKSRP